MWHPISKITKAKRSGGMIQAVEHLPSKLKTLSSNPSTTKKRKEKSPKPKFISLEQIIKLKSP
jgi:hypothetical protein